MKKVIIPVALVLVVLLLGIAFARFTYAPTQEEEIREAVFRYQFEHNASGQQQTAKVYFIGVGKDSSDPTDRFMQRFADHVPPVRKASASHFVSGKGMVDKTTGEQGLAFEVGEIKWISSSEVEVSGGYYEAELSSSGNTYSLKREGGKWKVVKNTMNWISYLLPENPF